MNTLFSDESPIPDFPQPNSMLGEPIHLWWDEIVEIGVQKWGNPDPYFLAAIVKKESWFDASLFNAAEKEAYERGDPVWYGEYYGKGLLQLTGPWIAGVPTPSTFEWQFNMPAEANRDLAPELYDAYNGTQNLDRGSWYLKALYDHYDGDKHKIASAYRWGWQPVDAFLRGEGGVDPYNNGYITEVMNFRTEYMQNVGLTEEELSDLINGASEGIEICPPAIEEVRLNDILGTLTVNPGTPVYVTARIDDTTHGNSNITKANYTIGEASWATSVPMNALDSLFDSAVEEVTSAPSYIDTGLLGTGIFSICVYASDEMGNDNTTGLCQTLVVSQDTTEPMVKGFNINGETILTVLLSSPPSELLLSAIIDDAGRGDSSIKEANYTLNGDWAGSQAMAPEDGSFNELNETVMKSVVPPSLPGTYTYCVFGMDQWLNGNTTGQCATVNVVDDVAPALSGVMDSPDPQNSGGTVDFEAVATDNAEIGGVWIEIIDPIGTVLGNYSMTFDSQSGKWKYSSTFTDLGVYRYNIHAEDTSSNFAKASGTFEIVKVADTTPPTITSIADSPDPQVSGGIVDFEATVTDDVAVLEVQIEIINPTGGSLGNFMMTFDAPSGTWKYYSTFNAIGTYDYIVRAKDSSHNWANDVMGNFDIISVPDTTPPTIMSVMDSPDPQIVGGFVTFEADVTDDKGVISVWINISGRGNFSMGHDVTKGVWFYVVDFNTVNLYSYTVWAFDGVGNVARASGSVDIVDNTPLPLPDPTPPVVSFVSASPAPQ
jgi:hypothetical protein